MKAHSGKENTVIFLFSKADYNFKVLLKYEYFLMIVFIIYSITSFAIYIVKNLFLLF